MSKKMKGVAFDASPHVPYENIIRTRVMHQTLLQDYLDLQQETKVARNKLEAMKQKKHTLEAEVRFLRRRHKFLMKNKSSALQQGRSHDVETTLYRKNKNEKVSSKKMSTLLNLPPVHNQIQRGKLYNQKKNIIHSQPRPVFDLDMNVNLNGNISSPMSEINQKESGHSGKQAKAPIFDLNQISMEEEEQLQESFENQVKEQQNDLKLAICRNVGDGSTNRSGKRKISWQDPVALRV